MPRKTNRFQGRHRLHYGLVKQRTGLDSWHRQRFFSSLRCPDVPPGSTQPTTHLLPTPALPTPSGHETWYPQRQLILFKKLRPPFIETTRGALFGKGYIRNRKLREQLPPKLWCPSTIQHGLTSKRFFMTVSPVARKSNLTQNL